MSMISPVTNPDSGEARNTTACETCDNEDDLKDSAGIMQRSSVEYERRTSLGVQNRLTGIIWSSSALFSSVNCSRRVEPLGG